MIISDKTLKVLIGQHTLEVRNLSDPQQIQPASVDFRLGNSFSYVSDEVSVVTFDSPPVYSKVIANHYLLLPKQFILATTQEYFKLPNDMTAFVEGRSSIGRMGLFVQNAGWVDPGFEGEITLELFNAGDKPILLEAGRRVGQLVFAQLDQEAENPYQGKYQGQIGATGSRAFLDKENDEK